MDIQFANIHSLPESTDGIFIESQNYYADGMGLRKSPTVEIPKCDFASYMRIYFWLCWPLNKSLLYTGPKRSRYRCCKNRLAAYLACQTCRCCKHFFLSVWNQLQGLNKKINMYAHYTSSQFAQETLKWTSPLSFSNRPKRINPL